MRRLGWAFLRAPSARRAAALTLTLGLLGGNGVLLASTAYAAPVTSPGLLAPLDRAPLDLHLLNLPGGLTLTQAACQLLPSLCGSPGTQLLRIPSGVATLGRAGEGEPGHARNHHVVIPATGCLLGLLGCATPRPTPARTTPTPAPRATPTVAVPTATPSPLSTPSPSAPASTPTPAAGLCLLGLLGSCPVSQTATGTPTPTPAPTSAPSQGLCILICNVLQVGGGSCVATLLGTCLVGPTTTPPPPSGSSGGTNSTGTCLGSLCLLGSTCTASLGTTCVLGALLLPGLPALLGSNPPPAQGTPGAPSVSATAPTSGVAGSGGSTATGASGTSTLLGYAGNTLTGSPSTSSSSSQSTSGSVLAQPHDQTLGLVSGLSFGHGLILWPLFGLLDLAALAGLVVVVRRRWAANTN